MVLQAEAVHRFGATGGTTGPSGAFGSGRSGFGPTRQRAQDNGPPPTVVRQGTVALFGGDAGRERSVARAAFREVF